VTEAIDLAGSCAITILAADQSTPSMGAQRRDRAVLLADALAGLPEAQREVVLLRHWDGWPLTRVAEHLGKQGLQIGSGPTESQCKQVPRRVKGRGKRWDAANAESVMALEAMEQSGLSQAYWKQCAASPN